MFEKESAGLWIATVSAAIVSHGIGFFFLCPNPVTRFLIPKNAYERIHDSDSHTNPHSIPHTTRSLLSFLTSLIQSYIHLHLLLAFSSFTASPLPLPQALYSTLLVWLAYVVPVVASDVLWEGRNCHTAVYSAARQLVAVLAVTGVFYVVDLYVELF
ncbi:hypothetical protein HDU98_001282 [Podochytrium sp. JEL0797]|nr:hypothetical protein HDU98_001282 [Podochytrium sp. JEL0797]